MTADVQEFAGLAEVADILGVRRQRALAITATPGFPAPRGKVRATRIWETRTVVTWALDDPRYAAAAAQWQAANPTPPDSDDHTEPGTRTQWCVRLADDPFTEAIGRNWYGPKGEAQARWWERESKPGATVYRRRTGPWEVAPDARHTETRPQEGTPAP